MRSNRESGPAIPRRIVGFHQDEESDWVAELECGHDQHVRHDPPWQTRAWVTTESGRRGFIGYRLTCVECGKRELRREQDLPRPERASADSNEASDRYSDCAPCARVAPRGVPRK